MQMAAAPQLGVTSYKPEAVNQVQPRGISMMVSGETAVPYGTMMPQLATLQIGNSVSSHGDYKTKKFSQQYSNIYNIYYDEKGYQSWNSRLELDCLYTFLLREIVYLILQYDELNVLLYFFLLNFQF